MGFFTCAGGALGAYANCLANSVLAGGKSVAELPPQLLCQLPGEAGKALRNQRSVFYEIIHQAVDKVRNTAYAYALFQKRRGRAVYALPLLGVSSPCDIPGPFKQDLNVNAPLRRIAILERVGRLRKAQAQQTSSAVYVNSLEESLHQALLQKCSEVVPISQTGGDDMDLIPWEEEFDPYDEEWDFWETESHFYTVVDGFKWKAKTTISQCGVCHIVRKAHKPMLTYPLLKKISEELWDYYLTPDPVTWDEVLELNLAIEAMCLASKEEKIHQRNAELEMARQERLGRSRNSAPVLVSSIDARKAHEWALSSEDSDGEEDFTDCEVELLEDQSVPRDDFQSERRLFVSYQRILHRPMPMQFRRSGDCSWNYFREVIHGCPCNGVMPECAREAIGFFLDAEYVPGSRDMYYSYQGWKKAKSWFFSEQEEVMQQQKEDNLLFQDASATAFRTESVVAIIEQTTLAPLQRVVEHYIERPLEYAYVWVRDASQMHHAVVDYDHPVWDRLIASGRMNNTLLEIRNTTPNTRVSVAHSSGYNGSYQDGKLAADLAEQADLDNSTGGLVNLSQLTRLLAEKKKGKFANGYEGHVGEAAVTLRKQDVFKDRTIAQKLNPWFKEATVVTYNDGIDNCDVRYPRNEGDWMYSPLPRMKPELIRKLAEREGVRASNSIAMDLGIQSEVAQGVPIVGFSAIMDDNVNDPEYATLAAAYFDLSANHCRALALTLTRTAVDGILSDPTGYQERLYLGTCFPYMRSAKEGKVAFQYGVKEFQEHSCSAYAGATNVRDSWADILHSNRKRQKRIVAGLHAIAGVSQEFDQSVENIPEITVKVKRSGNDILHRTINKGRIVEPYQERSMSMRLPPINLGRNGSYQKVDGGGPSGSDNGYLAPHRHSTSLAHSALGASSSVSVDTYRTGFFKEVTVKADAKEKTIVANLALLTELEAYRGIPYEEWKVKGQVHPNMRLIVTLPQCPFLGIAIACSIDYYNRVGTTRTRLDNKIANQLPMFVCALNKQGVYEHQVNMLKDCGHTIYAYSRGFADPHFIFHILADNALPSNAEWLFTVELQISTEWPVENFAMQPIYTLPHEFNDYLPLDLWRGPLTYNQVTAMNGEYVSLNFGEWVAYDGVKKTISLNAAMMQMFAGYGGELDIEVVRTSTMMVSCALHVTTWWGSLTGVTRSQLLKMQGTRLLEGSGPATVALRSPYARLANRDTQGKLVFVPVGGPIAPGNCAAPFQFMVHVKGVRLNAPLTPLLPTQLKFAWCVVEQAVGGKRIPAGKFELVVPARLSDLVSADYDISMFNHPVASLIAASGFIRGKMRITFDWTTTGNLTQSSAFVACQMGTFVHSTQKIETILSSCKCPLYANFTISQDVVVGGSSGFVTSGGAESPELGVRFLTLAGEDLRTINISIELDPGFEIYGRSIAPLK